MVAALVAAAALAIPPGFHGASRPLEAAASFVAGKPVRVYCSDTNASFQRYAATVGADADASGLAVPGGDTVAVLRAVCDGLDQQRVGFGPARKLVAAYVLTLTHEAVHARGESDEGKAECSAMHEMPRVAVRFFAVRAGAQLRSLMAAAWAVHRAKPAEYRTVC